MTPGRDAAAADASTEFRASTPWGTAVIRARGPLVTGVRPPLPVLDTDARVRSLASASAREAPVAVRDLADAIQAYLAGELVEVAPRAAVERWLRGLGITGFRFDASMALHDVPRGVTLSYGELAALAGRPGAARAAGSMCARNPLPLVVPCHRVVHAGARHGDVGSYGAGWPSGGGAAYKRRLLELEDAPLVRSR